MLQSNLRKYASILYDRSPEHSHPAHQPLVSVSAIYLGVMETLAAA